MECERLHVWHVSSNSLCRRIPGKLHGLGAWPELRWCNTIQRLLIWVHAALPCWHCTKTDDYFAWMTIVIHMITWGLNCLHVWLLWIMLLWTFVCTFLWEYMFSLLCVEKWELSRNAGSHDGSMFNLLLNCLAAPFCIPPAMSEGSKVETTQLPMNRWMDKQNVL